jgi:hypothetical protein
MATTFSDLPKDVVSLIFNFLSNEAHNLRILASVCSHWRSVVKSCPRFIEQLRRSSHQSTRVMLVRQIDDEDPDETKFYWGGRRVCWPNLIASGVFFCFPYYTCFKNVERGKPCGYNSRNCLCGLSLIFPSLVTAPISLFLCLPGLIGGLPHLCGKHQTLATAVEVYQGRAKIRSEFRFELDDDQQCRRFWQLAFLEASGKTDITHFLSEAELDRNNVPRVKMVE